MKAKIVIVGGGVQGTSIALNIAKRLDPNTEPVVLLERSKLASGTSGRSGAILRQHYKDRFTAAMARDSLRYYAAFEGKTGRSIGYTRTGVLSFTGPERKDLFERLERDLQMHSRIGIEVRRLEAEEIRQLVPGIVIDDGTIGAWEPDGGYLDPGGTVQAFAALARTYGAVTRLGVGVNGLILKDGRVAGIKTDEGDYEAEKIVLAAGPWCASLLKQEGVEIPFQIIPHFQVFLGMPEVPQTESIDEIEEAVRAATQSTDDGLTATQVFERIRRLEDELESRFLGAETMPRQPAHPVLLDLENDIYVKCEPAQNRSRVGRLSFRDLPSLTSPDAVDETEAEEYLRVVRERLCTRIPAYAKEKQLGHESGWFNVLDDNEPVIGPIEEIPGLYVVSGFSGHGFKFAPSIGEGMAQLLSGEPVSAFDPEYFSPSRFKAGAKPYSGNAEL